MASKHDRQQVAQLSQRILDAVERGELDADSPAGRRLLRRLEGAAVAWEAEAAGPFRLRLQKSCGDTIRHGRN